MYVLQNTITLYFSWQFLHSWIFFAMQNFESKLFPAFMASCCQSLYQCQVSCEVLGESYVKEENCHKARFELPHITAFRCYMMIQLTVYLNIFVA